MQTCPQKSRELNAPILQSSVWIVLAWSEPHEGPFVHVYCSQIWWSTVKVSNFLTSNIACNKTHSTKHSLYIRFSWLTLGSFLLIILQVDEKYIHQWYLQNIMVSYLTKNTALKPFDETIAKERCCQTANNH